MSPINVAATSDIQNLLPYATPLLTTAVAIIAIITSRLSSRDIIMGQWRQEIWKERSKVYLEIVRLTDRQDPNQRPTPEGFEEMARDNNGHIELYAIHPDSDEWREFTYQVETYSSNEVRHLFNLWDAALAGWSMTMAFALGDGELAALTRQKARDELEEIYKSAYEARKHLIDHIRAELRFEHKKMPQIRYEADVLGMKSLRFGRMTKGEKEK